MVRAYFGAKEMIFFGKTYYSPRHLDLRAWMWGSIFHGLQFNAIISARHIFFSPRRAPLCPFPLVVMVTYPCAFSDIRLTEKGLLINWGYWPDLERL